jgi:hypothetical protein
MFCNNAKTVVIKRMPGGEDMIGAGLLIQIIGNAGGIFVYMMSPWRSDTWF